MVTKFTEEEIQLISELQQEYAFLAQTRGQLEFTIDGINDELERIKTQHRELGEKERLMAERLNKKYGVGTLNIDTAEFTPDEPEK